MDWRISILVASSALGIACGPSASAADTDAGTDTDTDTMGSTGADTSGTDPTAGSTSGGATTSTTTTDPTQGSADTSGSSGDPTEGSASGSETGDCPYGAEGCLCDVGARCDEGLSCSDEGLCVAPPACRPIDAEPHDDEASAIVLEAVACDEGMELGVIATLEGPQTDWFTFPGNDAAFCAEQPIAIAAADASLEVCVFLECTNGGDVDPIACGGEAVETTSPAGRPGCCASDVAFVDSYDCTGFGGKNVDVYVAIASTEEICVDYSLEYGF